MVVAKEPSLGVFVAIRSEWGHGLEIQKAVDVHIKDMYDSEYAEPSRGDDGLFDILYETRKLAIYKNC